MRNLSQMWLGSVAPRVHLCLPWDPCNLRQPPVPRTGHTAPGRAPRSNPGRGYQDVSLLQGCNKVPQAGGLETTETTLSKFWRPRSEPGVSRAVLPRQAPEQGAPACLSGSRRSLAGSYHSQLCLLPRLSLRCALLLRTPVYGLCTCAGISSPN